MFFAKALGACLLAVFGGFWFAGAFDSPAEREASALNLVRQAELADNARADSQWGPECNALRDKLLGMEGGLPIGIASDNPFEGIAKLQKAERKLRAAGCDIDKAPGAFSPFEPGKGNFKTVTTEMDGGPKGAGGWGDSGSVNTGGGWGGDSNVANEGGSDDWGTGE